MAKTKEVTIERVRREVQRMDSQLTPEDDAFKAAVVCLSAAATGQTTVTELARFTGYQNGEIAEWVRNLKANGVFLKRGVIAADWFGKDGGIAFWMDVNVALGLMQRA
jgi:hypothetical protein